MGRPGAGDLLEPGSRGRHACGDGGEQEREVAADPDGVQPLHELAGLLRGAVASHPKAGQGVGDDEVDLVPFDHRAQPGTQVGV